MKIRTSANVFKRELRTFLVSPIAYIVTVIFLIVTGWFFFSPFFLVGRADIRDFFSLLPIILVFFIPAITMRLFSEEYSAGSIEVIQTLPVTNGDILEIPTHVELEFMQGRRIDLSDKQKLLWLKYQEKYRQRGVGN